MKSIRLCLLVCLLLPTLQAAAPPTKAIDPQRADKAIREVAGSAEYLRSVPKKFGILQSIDASKRRVSLLFDGDKEATEWPLIPDAEIKIDGWWGRLDQLTTGQRVWVWHMTDRKNKPVAIAMLADDISQQDIHGSGLVVQKHGDGVLTLKPDKGPNRVLKTANAEMYLGEKKANSGDFAEKSKVFVRGKGDEALIVCDTAAFEQRRQKQREALRGRWVQEGLPGSVSFVHVFSGEMDLLIDHEGMRWARSLTKGDKVALKADPEIACVVKDVRPWRERTMLRLVAKSRDLTELKAGERMGLAMATPSKAIEDDKFPPDMNRVREKAERVEWFLASIYCTCGVRGDTCTGHFYTLASCNPNGCGQPNSMRRRVGELIDKGMSDRQIFETLLKEEGPGLLQPHLLP